jgi:nucleotide-binding universal stress UspA family protein
VAANNAVGPAIATAERMRQNAEDYLQGISRQLAGLGVRSTTVVRIGNAATEIVKAAKEFDVGLIAMTTQGGSGVGRLVFGSIADAVLRRVEIPVFVLRMREETPATQAA